MYKEDVFLEFVNSIRNQEDFRNFKLHKKEKEEA